MMTSHAAQNITPEQHLSGNEHAPVQRYCYHCRCHHSQSAMRRLVTRSGTRWRCLASIAAARQDTQAREKFGRETSAANRADSQQRGRLLNQFRQLSDV
jgi:hypothetical protein